MEFKDVAILCHEADRHLKRALGQEPGPAWGRLSHDEQALRAEKVAVDVVVTPEGRTGVPIGVIDRLYFAIIDAVTPLFVEETAAEDKEGSLETEEERVIREERDAHLTETERDPDGDPVRDDLVVEDGDLGPTLEQIHPELVGVQVVEEMPKLVIQ